MICLRVQFLFFKYSLQSARREEQDCLREGWYLFMICLPGDIHFHLINVVYHMIIDKL